MLSSCEPKKIKKKQDNSFLKKGNGIFLIYRCAASFAKMASLKMLKSCSQDFWGLKTRRANKQDMAIENLMFEFLGKLVFYNREHDNFLWHYSSGL